MRWYVFWLEETDGTPVMQPGEGITSQWSSNGKSWSAPQPVGFEEAGATSLDVLESAGAFYALGLTTNPLTGFAEVPITPQMREETVTKRKPNTTTKIPASFR